MSTANFPPTNYKHVYYCWNLFSSHPLKIPPKNRIISLSVSLLIYLPISIYLSSYKSSSLFLSATRLKNTYIYWNGWIYDGNPPSSDYHWRERQTEPVLWLVVSTWPQLPIGPWRGEYGAAPEAGRCALETARSPGREGVRLRPAEDANQTSVLKNCITKCRIIPRFTCLPGNCVLMTIAIFSNQNLFDSPGFISTLYSRDCTNYTCPILKGQ